MSTAPSASSKLRPFQHAPVPLVPVSLAADPLLVPFPLRLLLTLRSPVPAADPVPQFSYFVEQLVARHPALAYVHVVEARVNGYMTVPPEEYDPRKSNDFIRKIWQPRPLVSAGGYLRNTAIEVAEQKGDLIAFGRHYISNVSTVVLVSSTVD